MAKLLTITLILSVLPAFLSLDNGLGLTPQMGWNSWNHFACDINEEVIKQTAETLIATGLAAKGYNYVNLDDCWQVARDETGKIVADPAKFPSGIAALADFMHQKGLKFGLYSDAGSMTCQKRPGSLGFEEIDANTYAEWGVDYLKYDNCNNEGIDPKLRYPPMTKALNQTGRQIFFSMCEWGREQPWLWARDLANSWRTTVDIKDHWLSFIHNLEQQSETAQYAGPGGWNDPDMLEVGNGGMSETEYESHFALWAAVKAPLIIGCDVANMDSFTLNLLSNEEIIAVNQDPLGIQAAKVFQSEGHWLLRKEVWAGKLSDGFVAVLFNKGLVPQLIEAKFADFGADDKVYELRDLINKKDLGDHRNSYSAIVQPHGVVMIKLVKAKIIFE